MLYNAESSTLRHERVLNNFSGNERMTYNAMGTLNAANEVAVEHFLNNKISFLAIAKIIQYTLDTVQHTDVPYLSV
jgi:1-deoxy-D-xylulose 5-phosphate reductoisomerase